MHMPAHATSVCECICESVRLKDSDSVVLSRSRAAVGDVALLFYLGGFLEDAEDVGATQQRRHVVARLAERLLQEGRLHLQHRLEARSAQRVHGEVTHLPGVGRSWCEAVEVRGVGTGTAQKVKRGTGSSSAARSRDNARDCRCWAEQRALPSRQDCGVEVCRGCACAGGRAQGCRGMQRDAACRAESSAACSLQGQEFRGHRVRVERQKHLAVRLLPIAPHVLDGVAARVELGEPDALAATLIDRLLELALLELEVREL